MSTKAPSGVYVYQPHSPQTRKDGLLWHIGGLPSGLTKAEAEAVAEAINEICWMGRECAACAHVSRFESDSCPSCGVRRSPPWETTHTREHLARHRLYARTRRRRTA